MFELMIFAASFMQVFSLGLNSKFLRDDKIIHGFVGSWFITAASFTQVWVISHADLTPAMLFLFGGLGGSLGITFAQWFHKRYFINKLG